MSALDPLPAGTRKGFVVAMWLIPLAVLILAELGLRAVGAYEPEPLFIQVEGAEDYLTPNPEVGKRFFGEAGPAPGPAHHAFRAEKPRRGFRLVVQGGSSAAGFPYGHGGTFPRMLEQRLTRTFPDRLVEVVNTGMDAVSSWALVDLAPEIVAIRPDAVLVYAGHNEYFGALGAASVNRAGGAFATRLYLALDESRLFTALARLWGALLGGDSGTVSDRSMMESLATGQRVRRGSETWQRGVRQFERNLTDLACGYRDAGIPVFLGTVASNERHQPPFDPGPFLEGTGAESWSQEYAAAQGHLASGDSAEATARFTALLETDPDAAGPLFGLARIHDAAGRTGEAAAAYAAARDRDGLPFRAPSEMNEVIGRVADACDAVLVDARGAIAAQSPLGIPGQALFLEHLHPNVDGYFVLADAFYAALEAAEMPETWSGRVPAAAARREVLVTELDTLLAAVHVRRLITRWPFDTTAVSREDTLRAEGVPAALAADVIAGRRSWLEAMTTLGSWYTETGRSGQALQVGLTLIQEYPYSADIHTVTADLLRSVGALEQALLVYREADRIEPTAATRRMVGQMQLRTGQSEAALRTLRSARAMAGAEPGVLYDLGLALLTAGETAEALRVAEELVRTQPDYPNAERLLDRARADSAAAGAN